MPCRGVWILTEGFKQERTEEVALFRIILAAMGAMNWRRTESRGRLL